MVKKEIQKLWEEVRELSLGDEIDRLDPPPSPVEFLRNYVSQNKPCIISGAIPYCAALTLWTDRSYLLGVMSQDIVSVHSTPNGREDALTPLSSQSGSDGGLCVASAHVQKMPFKPALHFVLMSCRGKQVSCLHQQKNYIESENSSLALDCDREVLLATKAFGCSPVAMNLWIDPHLSETPFHKDHYENLYAVIDGEKHFVLVPPTDFHRLYVRQYPVAKYSYTRGVNNSHNFKLEMEQPMRHVPWCSVDPYPSPENKQRERSKYPLYFNGPRPFRCKVKAGEVLYLPSMWYRHVRQFPGENGYTIAVNYIYEMQLDIKYAYFNFLQSLPYHPSSSSSDPTLSEYEDEDTEDSEDTEGDDDSEM